MIWVLGPSRSFQLIGKGFPLFFGSMFPLSVDFGGDMATPRCFDLAKPPQSCLPSSLCCRLRRWWLTAGRSSRLGLLGRAGSCNPWWWGLQWTLAQHRCLLPITLSRFQLGQFFLHFAIGLPGNAMTLCNKVGNRNHKKSRTNMCFITTCIMSPGLT